MHRPFLLPCLVVGALSFFACFNSACMMVETHPKYRKGPLGAHASQSKLRVQDEQPTTSPPSAAPENPSIAIPCGEVRGVALHLVCEVPPFLCSEHLDPLSVTASLMYKIMVPVPPTSDIACGEIGPQSQAACLSVEVGQRHRPHMSGTERHKACPAVQGGTAVIRRRGVHCWPVSAGRCRGRPRRRGSCCGGCRRA